MRTRTVPTAPPVALGVSKAGHLGSREAKLPKGATKHRGGGLQGTYQDWSAPISCGPRLAGWWGYGSWPYVHSILNWRFSL